MRSAGGRPSWLGGSGSSVAMASSNVEDATKVGRDAWSWASAADAWRASAWALGVRNRWSGVSNAGPDMWCWLGWDGVEMREAFIAAAWLLAARAAVTPLHSAVVRSRGGRTSEGLVVPPWAYRASSSACRKMAWVRRMALGSVRDGSRRRARPPRWTASAESGGSIEKKEEGKIGEIKASLERSWCRSFV